MPFGWGEFSTVQELALFIVPEGHSVYFSPDFIPKNPA